MSDLSFSIHNEMAKTIDYQSAEEGDEDDLFHYNQKAAALKIFDEFQTKNYVQLQAQMQSGKTGCSLFTIFKILETEMATQFFIFSGMSDTDLKNQWENDIKDHKNEYISWYQNDLSKKLKKKFIRRVEESTKNIYFCTNLNNIRNIEMIQNSIIIIDEIHYGSDDGSMIHNLFKRLGIQDILKGEECTKLQDNNIKFLTVSATRGTEDSIYNISETAQYYWGRVYMEPGWGYKSIFDYRNEGRIKSSIELVPENKNEIIEILDKYKNKKKYLILRAKKNKINIFKN